MTLNCWEKKGVAFRTSECLRFGEKRKLLLKAVKLLLDSEHVFSVPQYGPTVLKVVGWAFADGDRSQRITVFLEKREKD